jgi:hypothetical protein
MHEFVASAKNLRREKRISAMQRRLRRAMFPDVRPYCSIASGY